MYQTNKIDIIMAKTGVSRSKAIEVLEAIEEYHQEPPQANEPDPTVYAFPVSSQHPPKDHFLQKIIQDKESRDLIIELLNITGLPIKLLAEKVFEVTPKTLASYKTPGKVLPKRMQEIAIKLRELYRKGEEIFGDKKRFNEWMSKPERGVNYHIPLELINSVVGIDYIYDELVRIEFGDIA
ncbi:MAG: MbcA/ParS/Xre antitoxin family protein [Bacteroidales bacterium]|nr:MbcA/ParS/Xre antitoxin family protein [Bacteroidales bacterium]MCF8334587.1 MbcA/ParS/Xre antitoxin family protein [Bacteroidales bacterium]